MSLVIRFTCDDYEPRYVERLNGFMPPTLTDDIKRAKLFTDYDEAFTYVEKFRKAAVKEGSETTTIEAIECYEALGKIPPKQKAPPPKPRSPYYIEQFGEPRGHFQFGKDRTVNLYIKKNDEGDFVYAYSVGKNPQKVEAADTDGEAVITAMCKAAMLDACAQIRAFDERRRANG